MLLAFVWGLKEPRSGELLAPVYLALDKFFGTLLVFWTHRMALKYRKHNIVGRL